MPSLLLPRRAGRPHRNRQLDAAGAVHALRQSQVLTRDQLIDEILWLASRAKWSGNRVVWLMLCTIAEAMRSCRAHEMLGAMALRREGGAQ